MFELNEKMSINKTPNNKSLPERSCHRHASRESGFTLIELSITLFLIGVLFFISMPKIGNFLYQKDLSEVARSLKSTVHVLRSKSISTHRLTTLFLDLDKNLYWGAFTDPDEDGKDRTRKPFLVTPRKLPEGTRFLDAANINTPKQTLGLMTSTFNSKGALEETVIHLSDQSKNVLTIIVNAYTGRFSIFDEYVDVEYQ
jgi:prepilin-type N-terminal cleavage/methylation domain-containing protein